MREIGVHNMGRQRETGQWGEGERGKVRATGVVVVGERKGGTREEKGKERGKDKGATCILALHHAH